jgi:hypothetical protein
MNIPSSLNETGMRVRKIRNWMMRGDNDVKKSKYRIWMRLINVR